MIVNILSKIISKVKGEEYKLDKSLSDGYIISLMLTKFCSLIWGSLRLLTLKMAIVHPSSTIKCYSKIKFGKNLQIGRNCFIDALSKNGLVFGNNCSVGDYTNIRLTGSLKQIANGVKIGNNVGLGSHGFYGCGVGSLVIGDDCIFGNYVSIHPENHNYRSDEPIRLQGVSSQGGVKIGNNCWIGTKATILDGTEIGSGCIVAAGAVVKGVFPDNVIIGGVPAKVIKQRCE